METPTGELALDDKKQLRNIAVPEPLHRQLKTQAARRGVSIRELVTPALEALVVEEAGAAR